MMRYGGQAVPWPKSSEDLLWLPRAANGTRVLLQFGNVMGSEQSSGRRNVAMWSREDSGLWRALRGREKQCNCICTGKQRPRRSRDRWARDQVRFGSGEMGLMVDFPMSSIRYLNGRTYPDHEQPQAVPG